MKQQFEFTTKEAADWICKRLRIKPLSPDKNGDFNVRQQSTMKRVKALIEKDLINARYSNSNRVIHETDNHTRMDIWIGDELLTVRCYKTN